MEKVFKFEFTFQEINVLMKGCEELPFKVSSSVRDKIILQYNKQIEEEEKAKKDTEKKEKVK